MSDDSVNRAVLYRRGPIKCGDVERRRFLEEVGCEDEVEFIGDAKAAGRQADVIEDGDRSE